MPQLFAVTISTNVKLGLAFYFLGIWTYLIIHETLAVKMRVGRTLLYSIFAGFNLGIILHYMGR